MTRVQPHSLRIAVTLAAAAFFFCLAGGIHAEDPPVLHTFERKQLTDVYYSEGIAAGDINGDGQADVVYGPYWFAGPEFETKREIYPVKEQNREAYADNFFSWIYDLSGDGASDVFTVGFPGTPAYVYENPGEGNFDGHWKKHEVFDWVSNESPHFTNLVGDERPELVCTRDGFFGFATIDWEKPLESWRFHAISDQVAPPRFGHGLGVGDVNGDGRMDVLFSKGWFEQPESGATEGRWKLHEAPFTDGYGGAEIYAYDVDGDGDNDVITSLSAHDYGLAWYEQMQEGEATTFKQRLIMGDHPGKNRYGLVFTEPHSVQLADIDGDGLKDIVTGKTFYSHHRQSPLWDAGAVVYWFRLVRGEGGVDWVPYLADGEAGIGRQVTVADVNADGLPDIVTGGMKGASVLIHKRESVNLETWEKAQPKVYEGEPAPSATGAEARRGPAAPIDPRSRRVPGAIEGESLVQSAASSKVTAGTVRSQKMDKFSGGRWSGDDQLWWTGAGPGDKLKIELPAREGTADLELVLTCARDYGIVQLSLDGRPLGEAIDLYSAEVVTSGVLTFPKQTLKQGKHSLGVEIVGANEKAVKGYMFGLDYVRFAGEGEDFAAPDDGFKPADSEGRPLNLDFETGTLDDWTAEGAAFAGQPIEGDTVVSRRGNMRSGHVGEFWIGGYEKSQDAPTGTLTSAPFEVTHPYAAFLVGGGSHPETRVELVRKDGGRAFYKIAGQDHETLRQVVVDLRAHAGKEIFIRLVDEHRGGWGHVNFDHFRLYEERPARVTPPLLELVADDYPHAGLSAEEAAAAMKLPDGFHASVFAAEPDVKQPIALALDDRGRVWIAEAYEYPIRAAEGKGRDRILIFEDTDGDGKFDERKVFAEGLNLVSGLEVGFGGAWVGAAPYLLFIPDRDGDDVADGEPQILLDGWGHEDTHETLNAFIWGPDGWLYGCHGVFTHSRVGKPGTPDDERVPLNAGIWRYHPTRHEFEVFAHGTSNPWGVDFNDRGQAFCTACVIPHLFHVIQAARYQRQAGQHFNQYTYRDVPTIADHLHYLGANPHGGNDKSDEAGGGHAHAGAMIYLGGAWPDEYRGQIFMNNIHGQRLNVDLLEPAGSGYVGRHGPDFLLTGDRASQILNLRYGPDGQAIMIDWYDMQACHRPQAEVHDRSNGRIYKISYGDAKHAAVDLRDATDLELAELVLHENDWYVRHARRILMERAAEKKLDPAARTRLAEFAKMHEDDTRRLRAAWALHVTGGVETELMGGLLADASPFVRGWAIQLAMEAAGEAPSSLLDRFAAMAKGDESPVVRLYLASALQRLPLDRRWAILEGLTSHPEDAGDHNLPLMYWYAAEPLAAENPERALAFGLSAGESIPLLREFMLRRIGSSDSARSLAMLVGGLRKAKGVDLQLTFLSAIHAALAGRRRVEPPAEWENVLSEFTESGAFADPRVYVKAMTISLRFGYGPAGGALQEIAETESFAAELRREAIRGLVDARDPAVARPLVDLIGDPAVGIEAIRGLAEYDQPYIAAELIDAYPKLSPEARRAALATLCSRPEFAVPLLKAIEAGRIPGTDLTADLVRQLQFAKNAEIDRLLADVWGNVRETAADKVKLIASYKQMLAAPGDADLALGRAVFAKTCQQCHTLYGVGDDVGPDLTGSNRANLDYLLSNIVDPSAVLANEYRQTVILTTGGRVISGLVRAEDGKSLTIRTADAEVILPKEEIDERMMSDKSMMPDDQLKQFADHEVRSLVAYLRDKKQAPLLATPDTAGLLFDGESLAGWRGSEELWSVENGEIVGKSAGLDHNEFLISEMTAKDFRLTLQIKLVDNAGNSGIQFRSQPDDNGSVKGYQADAGAGWWGKLYEEHGRALLWDKSGEQHVKLGEWNEYEIVARGSSIRTYINGKLCVDLDDPKGAPRGIFAFQLHSGGPTEVRFRNLKLEVLGE